MFPKDCQASKNNPVQNNNLRYCQLLVAGHQWCVFMSGKSVLKRLETFLFYKGTSNRKICTIIFLCIFCCFNNNGAKTRGIGAGSWRQWPFNGLLGQQYQGLQVISRPAGHFIGSLMIYVWEVTREPGEDMTSWQIWVSVNHSSRWLGSLQANGHKYM